MAASLGISLTHRDHAQAVRFVTGHSRKGLLPDNLDWTSLADRATTTVYYMAGRTAGRIAARLMEAGMISDMPAVIVSGLTRSSEKRWAGRIEHLGQAMAEIGIDEPVLIGVGSVFSDAAAAVERQPLPPSEAMNLERLAS